MDIQVHNCLGLDDVEAAFLQRVDACLTITADVSRADILLCCLCSSNKALVVRHVMPASTSSLYADDISNRRLEAEEHPLLFRALRSGTLAHGQKESLSSGAPIMQAAMPILHEGRRLPAALLFETNMVAYERHRRRNHHFRRAVSWLQEMCRRGELEPNRSPARFGQYDGIYLVNRERRITYMSGIAANMFRSIGIGGDLRRELAVQLLESIDADMIERAFHSETSSEIRSESDDGRIWIRKTIPLQMPSLTWQNRWRSRAWYSSLLRPKRSRENVDAVMVLVHNATESVQKQRELNVKAAIIQEVHHRVKNNLQTIAAMLRIQARRSESDEIRHQLRDAVNRILSMAVIHEYLSQDEHRPINVRDVCRRVADQVIQVVSGPDQQVQIRVEGPNVRLPADQATPTAMVINELLLNAMEHGVGRRSQGMILVELIDQGNTVQIIVEDDGTGVSDDFDPQQSQSLGLQIVNTLVTDDLKGSLRIEPISAQASGTAEISGPNRSYAGTRAIVTFPKGSVSVV